MGIIREHCSVSTIVVARRRDFDRRRRSNANSLRCRTAARHTPAVNANESIQAFLAGRVFAVTGASRDRSKYGNKVLRCYLQHGLSAYPVNPHETAIEGVACARDLASLPERVHGLSIITPPEITERLIDEAAAAGIRHVWMQPGAESDAAVELARSHGMNVIANGPCLLVVLGYRE
jgi:predicted CoA-binding protein